jgi:hypothetical protein
VTNAVLEVTIGTGYGTTRDAEVSVNVGDLLSHGTHVTMSTAGATDFRLTEEVPISAQQADVIADERWSQLLGDPDSIALLEQMAEQALAEYDAGRTRNLDELL